MDDVAFSPDIETKRNTFFRLVFGQAKGLVCIAFLSKNKKNFREEFFQWPEQENAMHNSITTQTLDNNVYFCPQLLSEKKRSKEFVIFTPNAWADLDTCPPENMNQEPTVVLETSPQRYQAFWLMDRDYDPDVVEDLSRRIAYAHADEGADRSGWDLTQLLRVPGTYNYKYNAMPMVSIISANRNRYRLDDFDYPATPSFFKVEHDMPEINLVEGKAEELMQEKIHDLNPIAWQLFANTPSAEVKSWSEVLWRLLMMLFESDFSREDVYVIAQAAACNKYSRDGRPAQQLWKEVCRAEARARLHHKLLVPVPETFIPLLTEEESRFVDQSQPTFVERYQEWAGKLGDAAQQYHQAGAFICLSSLLAGSVRLPTSYGTIVPNIWFMILADTTLTRKTTAMDLAMDLVMEVEPDIVMATDGSIEGLLTSLATRPGKPSVFLRDEFSGLIEQMVKKDYMAGMAELLTKLYDGKFQKRILRKEVIEVRDPRLIVFAGGIRNKVTSALNFEMVSSGFMPRFVFITAESDISKVKPIGPPTQRSTGERDAILTELQDLNSHYNREQTLQVENLNTKIQRRMVFDATMTDETWVRYNTLESNLLETGLKSDKPDIMTPIGDRLAKSILKASLLIAASRQKGEGVTIELIDLLRAIKFGQQWMAHAKEVMDNVGKSLAERELDKILNAIKRHPGGTSRSHLMQSYHLTARDATATFETLEQRGLIRRQRQGKGELLVPTEPFTELEMKAKGKR